MKRKGMGKGKGSGWKNLKADDPMRHSMSARGMKSAQKVPANMMRASKSMADERLKNLVGFKNPSGCVFNKNDIKTVQSTLPSAKDQLQFIEDFKKDKRGFYPLRIAQDIQFAKDTAPSAQEILFQEYGDSRNFITPNKLKVGKLKPNIAFELSSGSGFEPGTTMYGVTVVLKDKEGNTHRDLGLSKSFTSRDKAESYIKSLKNDPNLFRIGDQHWFKKENGNYVNGFLNKIFKAKMSWKENELGPYPISQGETVVELETIQEGKKIVPADKVLTTSMVDIKKQIEKLKKENPNTKFIVE